MTGGEKRRERERKIVYRVFSTCALLCVECVCEVRERDVTSLFKMCSVHGWPAKQSSCKFIKLYISLAVDLIFSMIPSKET